MNATVRLLMRRKDIDGAIMVQSGGLTPLILREKRESNFRDYLLVRSFSN